MSAEETREVEMEERETDGTRGVELLLREPEIVAWLDDRRPEPEADGSEDEPPRAA